MRRFSLNPATSRISTFSAPDEPGPETSGFQGYLDLALGPPDGSGLRSIDIVGASPFLFLEFPAGPTFCIHPIIPVANAGVIDCDGGTDLGVRTNQDHNIGVVGVGGFTAQQCTDQQHQGRVEGGPHPNVCNGPLRVEASGEGDSGLGAALIAPSKQFGTLGLPAQVSVEPGPCESHVAPELQVFGFVSARYRVDILEADNQTGVTLTHIEDGENFDCATFAQEDGPGRLVLSVGALDVPVLDAPPVFSDLVTVFDLDD